MPIPFACVSQLEQQCRNRTYCPICYEEGFLEEAGEFVHDHV